MGDHSSIVGFYIVLILLVAIIIGIFVLYEKKKRKKNTLRFKEFSNNYTITEKDLRSVPRVLIPDNISVQVKLGEKEYSGLKGKVVDMSLSGFRVSFKSPFKAIPEDQIFNNITITSPISKVSVKSLKIVRIENSVKKVVFALYIREIDEDGYKELKNTMIYFEKFSEHEN